MRKSTTAILAVAAAIAVIGGVVYQTGARERDYREQLSRGDLARREEQTSAAIEAYSAAIGLRPDSMLAYLRRGETYQQRGDLDAAARDFRQAAALDPSAPRPLEDLGDTLYARLRFRAAADAYERRLALDDRSHAVAYKLALAQYRDGNPARALTIVAQAIKLNSQFADAHYLRGLCLRDLNRREEAIGAFERAIALSPTMIPAREELADLYRAAARDADELEQLQLLASLDRDHVERQIAVALCHARAGHTDLAVLALETALERASTGDQVKLVPEVYSALGRVWLDASASRSDAVVKAVEALSRAAAGDDASSEVLTLYGRALARINRWEAAEQILQRAIKRYPVHPDAFLEYAVVAEHMKRFADARNARGRYRALAADRTAK